MKTESRKLYNIKYTDRDNIERGPVQAIRTRSIWNAPKTGRFICYDQFVTWAIEVPEYFGYYPDGEPVK